MEKIIKKITFDKATFNDLSKKSKDFNPIHFSESVNNPYFFKIYYGIAFPIKVLDFLFKKKSKILIDDLFVKFYYPIPFEKNCTFKFKILKNKLEVVLLYKKITLSEIKINFSEHYTNNFYKIIDLLLKISREQGTVYPGYYSIISTIQIKKNESPSRLNIKSFDQRFNYYKIEKTFKDFHYVIESFKKTFNQKVIKSRQVKTVQKNLSIIYIGSSSFLSQSINKLIFYNNKNSYYTFSRLEKKSSKNQIEFNVHNKNNLINLNRLIKKIDKNHKIIIIYSVSPKIFIDDNLVKIFDLEKLYRKFYYTFFKRLVRSLEALKISNSINILYPSSVYVNNLDECIYTKYKKKAKLFIEKFYSSNIKIIYYEFNEFNNYQNHAFNKMHDYKKTKSDILNIKNLIK